jgi:hypothetical protein
MKRIILLLTATIVLFGFDISQKNGVDNSGLAKTIIDDFR